MTLSLKGINLTNEKIQQHVFGDILKRSVVLELRYSGSKLRGVRSTPRLCRSFPFPLSLSVRFVVSVSSLRSWSVAQSRVA